MVLATEISGSESRRARASAGAVSALAGTKESLLISAQGEVVLILSNDSVTYRQQGGKRRSWAYR